MAVPAGDGVGDGIWRGGAKTGRRVVSGAYTEGSELCVTAGGFWFFREKYG